MNFVRRKAPASVRAGKSGQVVLRPTSQGGNVYDPPRVLPDCPPSERAQAVSAFDAICRERPLKPPSARSAA